MPRFLASFSASLFVSGLLNLEGIVIEDEGLIDLVEQVRRLRGWGADRLGSRGRSGNIGDQQIFVEGGGLGDDCAGWVGEHASTVEDQFVLAAYHVAV